MEEGERREGGKGEREMEGGKGERERWREGRGERRERGRKGRGRKRRGRKGRGEKEGGREEERWKGQEGGKGRVLLSTSNNAYSSLLPSHTSPNPLNNHARVLLCSVYVCVCVSVGGGGVPLASTDLCNGFGILHYFDVACVGACCYATIRNELQIQAILLPELWKVREGGRREGGRREGGKREGLRQI